MNKHHFKYMMEDIRLGLTRNKGSAIASIVLLFIALLLIGCLLLTRSFVQDAVDYVESQLAMKVYVEDGLVEDVAVILEKQNYTHSVEIETGEELIGELAFFFQGKEHLLDTFTNGSVEDAVKFQITDKSLMPVIAKELEAIKGIKKVVYPQQMAEILSKWITKMELYGTISLIIFLALAFVMVYITFHLAMYQRNRELKVKLLLGIDPRLVSLQFLLEGVLLGIAGSFLAALVVTAFHRTIFQKIQQAVPYLGSLNLSDLIGTIIIQSVIGVLLSLAASYLSTRKLIRHV
ncbi:FtsX-like permease family protein [Psychrobacillus sp. FSL W7-1457]|uniref:cell division protein FtsX n=1 Tax=unclassified Psychrobacillus TaxID=2636677 RepID=UPI0030F71535